MDEGNAPSRISVRQFWSTLTSNLSLFQVLENYHNAATSIEVANRRELLNRLLAVDEEDLLQWINFRCAVLLFFPPEKRGTVLRDFPLGEWRRIDISPTDSTPSQMDVPARVSGFVAVATRDLHDDETLPIEPPSSKKVSAMEQLFLEEIFSLHHLPDAPLDGGLTPLLPVPLLPIILGEGGFSIDGDEDFWRGESVYTIRVADKEISPYPAHGKAFCRPTKKVFDVVTHDELGAEGACRVELHDLNGPRFVLRIHGSQLVASVYDKREIELEPECEEYAEESRDIEDEQDEELYMG